MICKKCGSNIPDDSVFCNFCGEMQTQNQQVNDEVEQKITYSHIESNATRQPKNRDDVSEKKMQTSQNNKKTGLIIGVVIAFFLVVVALATGLYIGGFLGKNKEEKTTIETTVEEITTYENTIEQDTLDIFNSSTSSDEAMGTIFGSTYINEFFGLKFETPLGYTISEGRDGTNARKDMSATNISGDNVNIMISQEAKVDVPMSYITKEVQEMYKEAFGDNAEIEEGNPVTMAGEEYGVVNYKVKVASLSMKMVQYFRQEKGYIIIITFTSVNDGAIEEMIDAFSAY